MKYIFSIAITLLLSLGICSAQDNLKVYYKFIYKAEKNILDADLKAAQSNYDKAFAVRGVTPFGADIHNSMLLGIQTDNNDRVFKMMKMLLLKGVDTSYLRNGIFANFRTSKEWTMLMQAYPAIRRQSEITIDNLLLQQLHNIFEADQTNTKATYTDPNNPVLHHRADSLYRAYRALMMANDYLSEEKVGIETEDTLINFLPKHTVLAFHSFEDNDSADLATPFKLAIHMGKIKASFALHFFNVYDNIRYTNDIYREGDTLYQRENSRLIRDKNVVYLMLDKPTDRDFEFRNYFYMDQPEQVVAKIKYVFGMYCSAIHKKPTSPYFYQFGEGFDSGAGMHAVGDKVLDFCK